MSKTKISWTDQTWNVITGCTKRSIGCAYCYAESFTRRISFTVPKYRLGFDNVVTHPDALEEIKRIKKPQRIFVNSMSDTFHEQVSYLFLIKLFNTIKLYPQHRFVILQRVQCEHKFVNFEPLLENIMFKHVYSISRDKLDWVIIGAESGIGRRKCKLEWIEKLMGEARGEDIPVFIKQIDLNGKCVTDFNKFPDHLRYRMFPEGY